MKSILTKKVLIIVSIVSFIAIGAVILAFATGNTNYPTLSNPDETYYERLDSDGNVVYSITNQELYEQIKSNDGIQQLLYLTDTKLLKEYFNDITQAEIDNKILELKFGTSDSELIAEMESDLREEYENAFDQSMILAGFQENVDDYAKLIIAREKYVMHYAIENDVVSESEIVSAYLDSYFSDIDAIRIRFTSKEDADFVMEKAQLVTLSGTELRSYNGFVYKDETLLGPDDEIVEAYKTVDVYYFDENENILDQDGEIVYTKGAGNVYADADDNAYLLDTDSGNLIDETLDVVIESSKLFATSAEADTYKNANTEYFTVTRTDPYDMNEVINVVNQDDEVKYTISPTGRVFDETLTDVTNTEKDLFINKTYQDVADIVTVTENNSTELTDEVALEKYIEMYNYVYGLYRDELPVGSSVEDLIALDNEDLQFNFDEEKEINSTLATYVFSTLSIADDKRYSEAPKSISSSDYDFYYMAYKLSETAKTDVMQTIYDYIEPLIVIPSTIGSSIELPTETYYSGTITWSSNESDILSNLGVVTAPAVDTEVELTFTLKILGKSKSYTRTVTVLADGETVGVTTPEWTEVPLKDIMNDQATYDYLSEKLLNDYVYGDNGSTNIDTVLMETRNDLGFKIYDRYLGMDYQALDSSFVLSKKGDKVLLASFDKTLESENALEVSADDFYKFALTKNSALYTLYAAQNKELIYSTYYKDIFGEEREILKNKSTRMDDMYEQISNAKSYYTYLQNLYAQYGTTLGYSSFSDYAYSQYGTKTETDLLEYFVASAIQPYLIDETIKDFDIINELQDTVQEYYDNYFSLNVFHVLIHFDFDEDGAPDDYNEFKATLTGEDLTNFNTLERLFEDAINEFEGTFDELVSEFNKASRDDETWGVYKQNGFLLLTQDLNIVDEEDDTITHSLNYSGQYGIKDSYVPEFTAELVDLYQEYQLPQNEDITELESDLLPTEFGLHFIKVTPGDDFEKPSCAFTEEDPANPIYSDGIENNSDMPSMSQMELYALYKFYSMIYDLTDADVEETYNIVVPNIPTSVGEGLDVYFSDLLGSVYVVGAINVNLADRLADGTFTANTYSDATNAELMTLLSDVGSVYYEAIFGDIIED